MVAATVRFLYRLRGLSLRGGPCGGGPCGATLGLSHVTPDPRGAGARAPRSGFRVRARSPHPCFTLTRALLQLRCCSSALAALVAACARRPGRCSPPPPPASPAERALRAPVEQRVELEGARRERQPRPACCRSELLTERRPPLTWRFEGWLHDSRDRQTLCSHPALSIETGWRLLQ